MLLPPPSLRHKTHPEPRRLRRNCSFSTRSRAPSPGPVGRRSPDGWSIVWFAPAAPGGNVAPDDERTRPFISLRQPRGAGRREGGKLDEAAGRRDDDGVIGCIARGDRPIVALLSLILPIPHRLTTPRRQTVRWDI